MPAAARVIVAVELEGRSEIGVARARYGLELGIISTARVAVVEDNCKRRAAGMPFKNPAQKVGNVAFLARSGACGTWSPVGDVRGEILLSEGDSGRDTVEDNSELRSVGFSEDGDTEVFSETVHQITRA